jgi:hypothetical protein
MKKILSLLSLLVIFAMLVSCGKGGGETKDADNGSADAGGAMIEIYKIEGDSITFLFNEKDYPTFDEIDSVTVAGEFNGWDVAAADWQMTDDDGDGVWELTASLEDAACGSQFKFVTNEMDWQQPSDEKIDAKFLVDDPYGSYNMVVVCEE